MTRASRDRPQQEAAVRSATAADVQIGRRLHAARRAANLTQSALAAQVGMSFQQVQKYEKGASRIAATTLLKMAQALNIPLAYFFEQPGPAAATPPEGEAASLLRFAESAEGARLLRAYLAIGERGARKRMLELIEDLASAGKGRPE